LYLFQCQFRQGNSIQSYFENTHHPVLLFQDKFLLILKIVFLRKGSLLFEPFYADFEQIVHDLQLSEALLQRGFNLNKRGLLG
jgi:hypothetical protein